jgi:hypothetical protein
MEFAKRLEDSLSTNSIKKPTVLANLFNIEFEVFLKKFKELN